MDRYDGNRVRLEINLDRIAENFAEIRRHAPGCGVMPVLKANAYGLGGRPIAELLRDAGAYAFGVAEMQEALQLLPLGLPVQILGSLLPDEVEFAVKNHILCPLTDLEMARRLDREAAKMNTVVEGEVAFDSGMGRVGLTEENAEEEILAMSRLEHVRLRGIYSHFSCAFEKGSSYSQLQLRRFLALLNALRAHGLEFQDVHMAASDALNHVPAARLSPFTVVRCGINLYGYYDNSVEQTMHLKSALALKTSLAGVRTLRAGSSLGYGRMHTLKKDTRIGCIAAGYADGLPLALSNRGYVLVRGELCPVLGRVSMDYAAISLENVPEAQWGDEVVCIGEQNGRSITLDEWANLKGTHAYELLCSFGTRVRRLYLRDPKS